MRIKAYLENGDFRIIGVLVTDDIKKIANKVPINETNI